MARFVADVVLFFEQPLSGTRHRHHANFTRMERDRCMLAYLRSEPLMLYETSTPSWFTNHGCARELYAQVSGVV